jgi:hypothetical protein
MKPGLELRQALALVIRLVRNPILSARTNWRLIMRGLVYLAENPDVAWALDLIAPNASPPEVFPLILIVDNGRVIYSLLLAQGLIGNLPDESLNQSANIEYLRKESETLFDRPLQAILVDAAIIDRIQSRVAIEKDLDSFFVAGREIVGAVADGSIKFSPLMVEVEMLASLDGEELLAKFGPRYGLHRRDSVRTGKVLKGIKLALLVPWSRWRMRKAMLAQD